MEKTTKYLGMVKLDLQTNSDTVTLLLAILMPHSAGGAGRHFDAEVLRNNHGGLLSDDKSGPIRVRAYISRRD